MKLIYLKSALKCDSFDAAIDIKIQFFRVLVTIEPGRSLLQFVTTNCFDTDIYSLKLKKNYLLKLNKLKHLNCILISVKCKLCFGFEKPLTMYVHIASFDLVHISPQYYKWSNVVVLVVPLLALVLPL